MKAYMGVDIGSSSSKVAIINENRELLALSIINFGTGTDAVFKAREQALEKAGLTMEDIAFSIVTGYGRMTYKDAQMQITEITCHAKGAYFLCPDAGSIIDIGGQDSKVICLSEQGQVSNFAMNEKCAAGTGRFLEIMARVLGCHLDELSDLAAKATEEVAISSTCTVFAESEAISKLSAGVSRADVARGVHRSVAQRVTGLCSRVGLRDTVVMTGGVALNSDFVACMAREIGRPLVPLQHAQGIGAIGAALIACEKHQKMQA